ncbi:hypothetical protein SDC9_69744 [bioreactor metagenome]|uniref:Uncharacterized protein n=1 Tax=bioreactor metagenome TaxID=1076179 RepID=A0A644Y5Q6_9ZZZZ
MNFWEKITGSDMTKELKAFESRVKKLPADYQAAWEKINANLWPRSDFTGRNLMPIIDGVLGLLEQPAASVRPKRFSRSSAGAEQSENTAFFRLKIHAL